MLKDSYKLILIKEGDVNLRQYHISKIKVLSSFSFIVAIFLVGFYFSWGSVSAYAGRNEISKVREDNIILKENIQGLENQYIELQSKLESLQEDGDLIRKLLKLPKIDSDHRKVGVGGKIESHILNDYNYLVPIQGYSMGDLNYNYDVIKD